MSKPDLRAKLLAQIKGEIDVPRGHTLNRASVKETLPMAQAFVRLHKRDGEAMPAPEHLLTPLP